MREFPRLRALIVAAVLGSVVLALAPTTPAHAAEPAAPSRAVRRVVAEARHAVGRPYRWGAAGPRRFDCSGLAMYVFRRAGYGSRVPFHSALRLYVWYRARGLANRTNPEPGDLVIWGRGRHVGIYVGGGYAISALTNGVRLHRVNGVRLGFTAYLHTRLPADPVPRIIAASTDLGAAPPGSVVLVPR